MHIWSDVAVNKIVTSGQLVTSEKKHEINIFNNRCIYAWALEIFFNYDEVRHFREAS